ncbi:hypothetical protein IX83_03805 [Basilea psittacipulmonis DSM 24701]|uniref:histidine kinase n=1 Tax=Basilea psittacipulmonis DSM 24701 TaxID=1072685 RepID=A0A077DGE4_9BURK|nr:hypothetical protein IX83_03805 [Basilea psittacipulmonis DSM 24701]
MITPLSSKGSLVRYFLVRLVPALIMLILLDLLMTWIIIRKSFVSSFALDNIFYLMILAQVVLIVVFGLLVWVSVRTGIELIRDISKQIDAKGDKDLKPIVLPDVPTELIPVINHINDLFMRLNVALDAQKRFIHHAAHQLRTPLATLRLESEMMLSRDLPEDAKQRAERIYHISNRMIRLGEQILLLARVDHHVQTHEVFAPIELGEWMQEVGSQWWTKVNAKKIEFELNIEDKQDVWIVGDKLLLEELVGNLIDNALKYALPKKIKLEVTAHPPTIVVEDDGIGISQDDQPHIFEPFYRSAKAQVSGSGLGLQIVSEIARVHGAECMVKSLPEFSGTRMVIRFPQVHE